MAAIRRLIERWRNPLRKYKPDGHFVKKHAVEYFVTGCGEVITTHPRGSCAGENCVIHNPSKHRMRNFPTHWRVAGPFDIKPSHMERICPHGVGHPDPDSIAFLDSIGETGCGIHGCDGCCTELGEFPSVELLRDGGYPDG